MVALVTVDRGRVTPRVRDLLADARAAAKLPAGSARVMQGSYNAGKVGASAGTHDAGGAVDLSIAGLSNVQALTLVNQLRRRNGCAWLRSPAYGWPASAGGPHIHVIVRDEPGLSAGARAQVAAYDKGLNGLASKARDPHGRPPQFPMERVRLMAWKVNGRKMVKPATAVRVPRGKWVTLTTIDLPKGGDFDVALQLRVPRGLPAMPGTPPGSGIVGEACLGRRGWGTAKAGDVDETGHNPILAASTVEAWRTTVHHNLVGGGPLEFRVYLAGTGTAAVRFVAKAVRRS